MENQFRQTSKLNLTASFKKGKTILSDVSFTAPFKVMRPLYTDPAPPASGNARFMSVVVMQASPGIMAGDEQAVSIDVQQGAAVKVTTQAYEKIFCMEGGMATRSTNISLARSSCLYYVPQPVIPFALSHFESTLEVELEDESSHLVLASVVGAGRVAHGECFDYTCFREVVRVRRAGKLIYRDNTVFDPAVMHMEGFGMYEGFTHLGTLAVFGGAQSDEWLDEARAVMDEAADMQGGATRTASGDVVVKLLGKSADVVSSTLKRILEHNQGAR